MKLKALQEIVRLTKKICVHEDLGVIQTNALLKRKSSNNVQVNKIVCVKKTYAPLKCTRAKK